MDLHRTPSPAPPTAAVVRHLLAALAVGIALAACSGNPEEPVPLGDGTSTALPAEVSKVIDGDTVELRFAGTGAETVRLLGIDTPETVHPDEPVGCWGPEASDRLNELLPAGTAVLVQRDEEVRDRYGRLLVYLWRRHDGLFVNRVLISEGHARPLAISPNTAHRVDISASAATARGEGLGLWGACSAEEDRDDAG